MENLEDREVQEAQLMALLQQLQWEQLSGSLAPESHRELLELVNLDNKLLWYYYEPSSNSLTASLKFNLNTRQSEGLTPKFSESEITLRPLHSMSLPVIFAIFSFSESPTGIWQ